MAVNYEPQTFSAAHYAEVFERERVIAYPAVDAYEARTGYALDRARLEAAARVLECPIKAQPPNWQHGRVLYAVARRYLAEAHAASVRVLDIGTAKGFSALCLQWALDDAGGMGQVVSVDVLDPHARCRRNTPAEVPDLRSLDETLADWPESRRIRFVCASSLDYLKTVPTAERRQHVAFVDGKHDTRVVQAEGTWLAAHQRPGDVTVFDDVQMPQVMAAVKTLRPVYAFEILPLGVIPRTYAIGVRR